MLAETCITGEDQEDRMSERKELCKVKLLS
jgi:hypothetical protein